MRFSPLSFVLGLAAASLAPVLSRVFRPLAVEATAAGMGMLEDARRVFAPRMENLEDVIAEAQSRREQLDAETQATATDEASPEATVEDEAAPTGRVRRRTNGARRRAS
jgi:hypothetical protein